MQMRWAGAAVTLPAVWRAARLELLAQVYPLVAGWEIGESAEHLVTVAQVKALGLPVEGVQHHAMCAGGLGLLFGLLQ